MDEAAQPKTCRTCQTSFSTTGGNFYKLGTFRGKTYYKPDCRKCASTRKREKYAADLTNRALQIAYSHNASKQVKNGDLGWVDPQFVTNLLLSAHECPCCGKSREPDELFHLDHIIPLSRGGRHEEGNLRPLCEFCNMAKGERQAAELDEWISGIEQRAIEQLHTTLPNWLKSAVACALADAGRPIPITLSS